MKQLVIYYSRTGNNEFLAKEIARRLSCDAEAIVEQKKRTMGTLIKEMLFRKLPAIREITHKMEDYDHLILIAPVWGGIAATPMIAFIDKHNESIKKYSFISVCGGALGENAKLEGHLTKKTGRQPAVISQLYINNLLPEDKKNKTKYTSAYTIGPRDMDAFGPLLDAFIKTVS
jgi:flavodoxin